MLWGAAKLAALLAAIYAVYRLGLHVRDRLQGACAAAGPAKPGAAPDPLAAARLGAAPQRGGAIVVRCR
jgi:hypothetical protein